MKSMFECFGKELPAVKTAWQRQCHRCTAIVIDHFAGSAIDFAVDAFDCKVTTMCTFEEYELRGAHISS